MSQRHSKKMSPSDHVKCKWTFQPHHGSKVFLLLIFISLGSPSTYLCRCWYDILLRTSPKQSIAPAATSGWEKTMSYNFIPRPGSTMRPPLHILRGSIIQATTPPAASTSSPRKSQGLTTIFLLNLTVTYFQSIQQWPSYHGVWNNQAWRHQLLCGHDRSVVPVFEPQWTPKSGTLPTSCPDDETFWDGCPSGPCCQV